MANIYCDYSTGNDTTGNGSSGSPYKNLLKAISVCNGGDVIYLANTAAFPVTTPIVWTGSGATTAIGVDAPVTIRAWNNGGSITISHPLGNILAAEIDGGGVASTLFSSSSKPRFIIFEGIKFHNTTGTVVVGIEGWSFHQCEFYNAGSNSLLSSDIWNRITGCIFRDSGGSAVSGITSASTGTLIFGCYFYNLTGYAVDCIGPVSLFHNVIKNSSAVAIHVNNNRIVVCNNTVIGDGSANQTGILVNSGSTRLTIFNNLVTNHSGTGSKAIDMVSGSINLFGCNAFYNNTVDMNGIIIKGIDLSGAVYESASPFTNAAGNDFSLVSTALSKAAAFPKAFTGSSTVSNIDIGAAKVAAGSVAVSQGCAYVC